MFASLREDRAPAGIGMPPPRINFSEFRYGKDQQIFGESEPADYVYQVTFGAVRSYKLLVDGRRQIGAFHLVGDIFGLENAAVHRFTTEAIVDTNVRLVKRQTLELIAERETCWSHAIC
jgi:CRP/FNR family transcriptional regulator, nitrogen fixation regulation protein